MTRLERAAVNEQLWCRLMNRLDSHLLRDPRLRRLTPSELDCIVRLVLEELAPELDRGARMADGPIQPP